MKYVVKMWQSGYFVKAHYSLKLGNEGCKIGRRINIYKSMYKPQKYTQMLHCELLLKYKWQLFYSGEPDVFCTEN